MGVIRSCISSGSSGAATSTEARQGRKDSEGGTSAPAQLSSGNDSPAVTSRRTATPCESNGEYRPFQMMAAASLSKQCPPPENAALRAKLSAARLPRGHDSSLLVVAAARLCSAASPRDLCSAPGLSFAEPSVRRHIRSDNKTRNLACRKQ